MLDKNRGNGSSETEGKGSLLFSLWKKWKNKGNHSVKPHEDAVQDDTTLSQAEPPPDTIQEPELIQQGEQSTEQAPQEPLEPADASVRVWTSPSHLEAYACLEAPVAGGADVDRVMVESAIQKAGITFGLLDDVISGMIKEKRYGCEILIACGIPAENGRDGEVEDCYERTRKLKLEMDENGVVDFKNLNMVQNIEKGAVICNIVRAKPSKEGMNVFGKAIKAYDGREAPIPRGRNTELNEDGTKLMASCDGSLIFEDDKFQIDKILQISGNVDSSTGNIDFSGDVVINGDVVEGYTIKSCNDIIVKGSVEGAMLYAEHNIVLGKGMNGMQKGILKAGNDINSKFLENCTAQAGGCIYAESILNSNISADDKVVVKGRRGLLIGGTCTAKNTVQAKAVGSASHIPTVITLGTTPDMVRLQRELTHKVEEQAKNLDLMTKDIEYLEAASKREPLSKARQAMMAQKKKDKMVNMMQLSKISKQLEEVNASVENINTCRLFCHEIFSPAKIVIGNASLTISSVQTNRMFYYLNNEVKMGNSTYTG